MYSSFWYTQTCTCTCIHAAASSSSSSSSSELHVHGWLLGKILVYIHTTVNHLAGKNGTGEWLHTHTWRSTCTRIHTHAHTHNTHTHTHMHTYTCTHTFRHVHTHTSLRLVLVNVGQDPFDIPLDCLRNSRLFWWNQTWTTLRAPNSLSSQSASLIHLSTEQNIK